MNSAARVGLKPSWKTHGNQFSKDHPDCTFIDKRRDFTRFVELKAIRKGEAWPVQSYVVPKNLKPGQRERIIDIGCRPHSAALLAVEYQGEGARVSSLHMLASTGCAFLEERSSVIRRPEVEKYPLGCVIFFPQSQEAVVNYYATRDVGTEFDPFMRLLFGAPWWMGSHDCHICFRDGSRPLAHHKVLG